MSGSMSSERAGELSGTMSWDAANGVGLSFIRTLEAGADEVGSFVDGNGEMGGDWHKVIPLVLYRGVIP